MLHEPSPLKETLSLCISHFVRSVEEGSVDAVSQQTSQPVIGSRRQHRSDRGRVSGVLHPVAVGTCWAVIWAAIWHIDTPSRYRASTRSCTVMGNRDLWPYLARSSQAISAVFPRCLAAGDAQAAPRGHRGPDVGRQQLHPLPVP